MHPLPYASLPAHQLYQGDLLKRTEALDSILAKFHPRYFENKSNEFFLVLTQSCDLVLGRRFDPCKATYISICAVRPLSAAFERELKGEVLEIAKDVRAASEKTRTKVDQFLARLMNNNENGYFFLRAEPSLAIPQDYCAFLRLSVAIKASEHYETCIKARVSQLEPSFQAKLGWLLGDLYSRVGTTDWTESELRKRIASVSRKAAIWVDDKQMEAFRKSVAEWQQANPGQELTNPQIEKIIGSLPSRKKLVMARIRTLLDQSEILGRLVEGGHLTKQNISLLGDSLDRDPVLTGHLR